MHSGYKILFTIITCVLALSVGAQKRQVGLKSEKVKTGSFGMLDTNAVTPGAERTDQYLSLISGKRVAVLTNQTGVIGKTHLVDSLLSSGIDIRCIFTPEHGFRGDVDAGEHVHSQKDKKTGLPIVSLYGDSKKPSVAQLKDIDVLLFDLQDVGVRFYTYISTLHYVMEACAENGIPLILLDRPNPNGNYVDGPVLDTNFRSFVGMHPVPVVYGMTIGEYAQMINGEGWLKDSIQCPLKVIPCAHYTHDKFYELPVAPSPNLRNSNAIRLYPQLCLFEGTAVSVGRGTSFPFEVFGHPDFSDTLFSFVPVPGFGSAHPKLEGKTCYGYDLRKTSEYPAHFDLSYLVLAYTYFNSEKDFITSPAFFDKLSGNEKLRMQLINHIPEAEIRASWQKDLAKFRKIRKKYLLYI